MDSARILPLPIAVRRPGLDVLRASAAILVVLLHAGVPYTVAPMPGLTWPVRHAVTSSFVDAIFWGIEGAVMPLFFLLSGYGAAQSLASKSHEFLASRWRRLGWPLVGAAAVLLPLELYIWLIGWALDGQIAWKKLQSLKLGSFHDHLWGLSHLWYLEYLLLFSLMLWAAARWSRPSQSPPSLALRAFLLPLTMFILWFAPEVIVGFQHSFLPVPMKFLYSGLFFAAGVAQFHRPSRMPIRPAFSIACCFALLTGLLPLIHRQAEQPLLGFDKCLLVIGLACYATQMTRAIWQWAWDSRWTVSPSVDYLAKASFWVYLIHHPLVAIGQIALRSTGWPALVQFTIVTIGTLAVSLGSYELAVRRTWLGAFFEGRKTVPKTPAVETETPARRAA